MSTKARLTELSLELDRVFQELVEETKENRGVTITINQWNESLGANLDLFGEKLALFRSRLNKYIEAYPSKRKKKNV